NPPPRGPPFPPPPPNPPLGFFWFSVTAVVTMTLSPTTMGHDHAAPGTAAFHATFLSPAHSPGNLSVEMPLPLRPRNSGPSAAVAVAVAVAVATPSTIAAN